MKGTGDNGGGAETEARFNSVLDACGSEQARYRGVKGDAEVRTHDNHQRQRDSTAARTWYRIS